MPGPHPRAALLPALEQPRRSRPSDTTDDPADREDPALDTPHPRRSQQALRHEATSSRRWWTTAASSRCTSTSPRTSWWASPASAAAASASSANQPAVPGGLPGHRRLDQGGALRPLLRRLQHPARHLRGRARLPARHRPGVRRHHPARGEAALRLRRGHRPQDHGHHPQGLRRRLLRDGEQAHPHRPEPGLPDRRDRGDGSGGCGQHPLPARAREGRRTPRPLRAPEGRGVPARSSRTPTWPPTGASSTR